MELNNKLNNCIISDSEGKYYCKSPTREYKHYKSNRLTNDFCLYYHKNYCCNILAISEKFKMGNKTI